MPDPVKHPKHYNAHASGIECREVAEYLNSNLANAFKYAFRHELKNNPIQDIEKAIEYLSWESDRLNNDLTGTRFTVQPADLDRIKKKLTRIHDFECLTYLKQFYKNFYFIIADSESANKHVGICIARLQGYLDWLKRRA